MSEIAQIKALLEEQGRQFEQFKAANDERLQALAKTGTADAALVTQVEQINAAMTATQASLKEMEIQIARANLGATSDGDRRASPEARAHRAAYARFVRKGEEGGLRELEVKAALTTTTDSDGGYAVPEEMDREILDLVKLISPIRQIANVITVGTGYKKLVNKRGTNSGWVGETEDRPETQGSKLAELSPFWGEIYANPQATQTMLDDVFFNAEQWQQDETATEFAYQEGPVFIAGNGVNKPKGFLAYPVAATSDKAGRAFGTLQFIPSGSAATIGSTPDRFIDMVQSMKAPLRTGAMWLMNSLTVGEVRKLKDSEGQYYWQPSTQLGQPAVFLGYGVAEAEEMPDQAADAFPVAFGQWRRGYTIVDRIGIRTLRDPYTNKPYVGLYTTKRVGGMVEDSEAIKLLKCTA